MPNYGESLISKMVDENNISVLTRYGITREHFATEAERQAFDFIRKYATENGGQMPSYATVTAEVEGFTYIPAVTDSYEFLTRELKDYAGKRQLAELFNGKEEAGKHVESAIKQKFAELSAEAFADWLISEMKSVKMRTSVRQKTGTNVKTDTDVFLTEYQKRKAGESFRIWKSKFPTINREIGGYLSGNMYTWYGRSGRGKSVFTMEDGALEAASQGANVLVWAMEMSGFEWMARAYSSLSARQGIAQAEINGEMFAAGFENRAMLMGKLPPEFEESLRTFLSRLNETLPGNIILRAADDPDFEDRSLKALEADILATKADVVLIDPFYYLDYERNTSKTAGGDAAATSMRLRRLTGRLNVVMHVITQSDEIKEHADEEEDRDLNPPQRSEIKKTKQVLEDAASVFGIDTVAQDGRGIIVLRKGRNGGEDTAVETVYLPNYGIVRELSSEDEARKFAAGF